MKLGRPRSKGQWAAVLLGAGVLLGAAFWFVAPYNIAASIPHFPGVRALLHSYMANAVRTWSFGLEPPAGVGLDDEALVARGAGHFETGCAPCHGAPGRARNPTVRGMRPEPPSLAGAADKYADRELYWIALNGLKYTGMPAWPTQLRPEEPWAMAAFLRRYDALDADRYAALAYGPARPRGEDLSGSHAISFGGLTDRLDGVVRNCGRCHGVDGLGRDGVAPKLAGQSQAYLVAALQAYADGGRPSGFMQPVAASLSPAERQKLAEHFAALPPFRADLESLEPPDLIAKGARLAARGDARTDVPSCLACHGPNARPKRRDVYPHIAGQDRRWLETWLRLWRDGEYGGTRYAHLMHAAARGLADDQVEALAAFFAAGAPHGDTRPSDAR